MVVIIVVGLHVGRYGRFADMNTERFVIPVWQCGIGGSTQNQAYVYE